MNKIIIGVVGVLVVTSAIVGIRLVQIDDQIMNQKLISSQPKSQSASISSNSSNVVTNSTINSAFSTNSAQKIEDKNIFDAQIIQTHNKIEDCWVSFDGKVYDITKYATQHPGGIRSVGRYCGKSLDPIADTHTGGNFASANMQNILKKYLIGTIK